MGQTIEISAETIANARNDIQRLNCQLRELHLEEERCRLRRSRLEAEQAQLQTFIAVCELAVRFDKPISSEGPTFRIDPVDPAKQNGARLVTLRSPAAEPERPSRSRVGMATPGSKKALIKALLLKGASHEELLRATGWRNLSVRYQAQRLGMTLEKSIDRKTGLMRYRGILAS